MTVRVTQQLNHQQVQTLLGGQHGIAARDALKRGLRVETRAKQLLGGAGGRNPKRVDTGRLRSSITTVLYMRGGSPVVGVGTNVKYAKFVHDGTGLFGPAHKKIVPVNKAQLAWKTRGRGQAGRRTSGKGGWTYAMSSSGSPRNTFLLDALPAARS